MSKADPQRDRLYAMENRAFRSQYLHKIGVRRLRKMLKTLCRQSGLPVIPLKVYPIPKFYGFFLTLSTGCSISLCSRRGANFMTLCHEFAHYYTAVYFPKAQTHGPQFVGVYARALEAAKVMPRVAFEAAARHYGVKYKRL